MKTAIRAAAGCGLTAALILFSGNAWAYFEEVSLTDFESPLYNIGDLDNQDGWATFNDNGGAINIVSASAPGHGTQAIEFSNTATPGTYTEHDTFGVDFLGGPGAYVTFHVNPTFVESDADFQVNFNANDSIEAGLQFKYNAISTDYDLYVYDNGWTFTGTSVSSGWAEYSLQYQSSTAYSLYLDGGLVMDNITPGGGTFDTIDTIHLNAPITSDGGVQFDALYVNPEPATVFMMLMGLGLFCRERRRLFSV